MTVREEPFLFNAAMRRERGEAGVVLRGNTVKRKRWEKQCSSFGFTCTNQDDPEIRGKKRSAAKTGPSVQTMGIIVSL